MSQTPVSVQNVVVTEVTDIFVALLQWSSGTAQRDFRAGLERASAGLHSRRRCMEKVAILSKWMSVVTRSSYSRAETVVEAGAGVHREIDQRLLGRLGSPVGMRRQRADRRLADARGGVG